MSEEKKPIADNEVSVDDKKPPREMNSIWTYCRYTRYT